MAGTGQEECRGLRRARAVLAGLPAPPAGPPPDLRLRVGSFVKPLPAKDAGTFAATLLNLAMRTDVGWIDQPPRLETPFGDLPTSETDRCALYDQLADHPDGRGGDDGRLMRLGIQLEPAMQAIEGAWRARINDLRRRVIEVEAIAAQLLGAHLTRNLRVAAQERPRYLYPAVPGGIGGDVPSPSSPDYVSLRAALSRVAAARRSLQLDQLRRRKTIAQGVMLALTLLAVNDAASRSGGVQVGAQGVSLDARAWRDIARAAAITTSADAELAKAVTAYLGVLRREGLRHPVILVLDVDLLANAGPMLLGSSLDQALTGAAKAIGKLLREGANTPIAANAPADVTPTQLADAIASSGDLSIWKLPFFIGQALDQVPPAASADVSAFLELTAQRRGAQAVTDGLAMSGITAAAALVALAGPIGLAVSLLWSAFQLWQSWTEYEQLAVLFHASLDTGLLLRGLDPEAPATTGLVLDAAGVGFDLYTLVSLMRLAAI